jgi:glycosyltransferase involved in cell wall biosynthesis
VFPSLREGTGTVIVEAMSYGLPVVALNIHGARCVLNEDCAFLVPVTNKKQMVEDYRSAILSLYHDPELRRKMGESGRRRVQEYFLWDKRGKAMNDIYRQVRGMEP